MQLTKLAEQHWIDAPQRARFCAALFFCFLGLLGGILIGLTLLNLNETQGSIIYTVSVLSAVLGTYLMLILMLFIARLPIIEHAYGQDKLIRWHKVLGPISIWLIILHIFLIVLDHAGGLSAISAWAATLFSDIVELQWLFSAAVSTLLFAIAGIASWKRIRYRMRYTTWWTIHLYLYLAVIFSFMHQVSLGGPFARGLGKALWIACFIGVFAAIIWYRIAVPVWRSVRGHVVVTKIIKENSHVTSVIVSGRNLEKIATTPGQFFYWRFDTPGLMYMAHPYSVSDCSTPNQLRISVKGYGAASKAFVNLRPGTRVYLEGPYGVSTPETAATQRVILVAAGIGIAPLLPLATELAKHHDIDLIYRVSRESDLIFTSELQALAQRPNVTLHLLAGSRKVYPLDARMIQDILGDVTESTIYLCGPSRFIEHVTKGMLTLSADRERIHTEYIDW